MLEASIVYKKINKLGEGPVYDDKNEMLYWVDILDRKIYSSKPLGGGLNYIQLDDMVSAVALTDNDKIIAGAGHYLYLVSPRGSIKKISEIEIGMNTRFNDGKVSPEGQLVIGTMDLDEKNPIGSLYSFDGTSFKRILSNMTISNGLAWDVKKKLFYIIDSPTKKVSVYEYDKDMNLKYLGVAADLKDEAGVPDGMTIDAEGMIWVAVWGGGKIIRFDPFENKKLLEIGIPAKKTSSCTFGGKNMDTLFVTSAASENDLGGSLFAVKTEYQGTAFYRFKIKNLSAR